MELLGGGEAPYSKSFVNSGEREREQITLACLLQRNAIRWNVTSAPASNSAEPLQRTRHPIVPSHGDLYSERGPG